MAPFSMVLVGRRRPGCRDLAKPTLALYIGGMGARGKNFYNDLVERYGYEEAAGLIQDLYLEGRKGEAAVAVPDELVDDVALVGPPEPHRRSALDVAGGRAWTRSSRASSRSRRSGSWPRPCCSRFRPSGGDDQGLPP